MKIFYQNIVTFISKFKWNTIFWKKGTFQWSLPIENNTSKIFFFAETTVFIVGHEQASYIQIFLFLSFLLLHFPFKKKKIPPSSPFVLPSSFLYLFLSLIFQAQSESLFQHLQDSKHCAFLITIYFLDNSKYTWKKKVHLDLFFLYELYRGTCELILMKSNDSIS